MKPAHARENVDAADRIANSEQARNRFALNGHDLHVQRRDEAAPGKADAADHAHGCKGRRGQLSAIVRKDDPSCFGILPLIAIEEIRSSFTDSKSRAPPPRSR